MASLVKRTGFCLFNRLSAGALTRSYRNCAGGARMMMSRAVNSSPSSSRVMSPWLMLPPVFEEGGGGGDMVYKFYKLSEDKEESFRSNFKSEEEEEQIADADTKFVGSSHGWLALFNQRSNKKNRLFLYNPITGRHIKLPPIETLPDPWMNLTPDGRGTVSKLVLSSSPDDDDECIAMMTFGPEDRLAFCHPCRSTNWTPIGDLYYRHRYGGMFPRSYLDFVYSSTQKLLFCVTKSNHLECWDLSDPLSPPRIHLSWEIDCEGLKGKCPKQFLDPCLEPNDDNPNVRRYASLVYAEQDNQLFLVMRFVMTRMGPDGSYVIPICFGEYRGWDNSYPYRTIGMDVYKIELGVAEPQYMEGGSLDGLAMFIGINHSIAMSSLTPELKLSSNCIYFADSNRNPFPPSNSSYGGHDIGIFDYANRTISPCYCFPVDIDSIKRIVPPPMWFTPPNH